jgi:hypothetical protein
LSNANRGIDYRHEANSGIQLTTSKLVGFRLVKLKILIRELKLQV